MRNSTAAALALPAVLLALVGLAAIWWQLAEEEEDSSAVPSFILQPFPKASSSLHLQQVLLTGTAAAYPTVLVPGMGDSCFNPGFSQLVQFVSQRTQTKSFCHGPGFDPVSDAIGSFAKTMNEQVDQLHKRLTGNEALQHGFNAIGLSQGNLVIRAYIQKYNTPPVRNFISIHGPHAGVSSLPRCDPRISAVGGVLCLMIDSVVGSIVYTPGVQSALAQANYFRNQMRLDDYVKHCEFLPEFLDRATAEHRSRLVSLNRLVLIQASRDTMIFPKQSAQFGALQAKSTSAIVPMEKHTWYVALGLDELDRQGKLVRLATSGNHLQFSKQEFDAWVDEYFVESKQSSESSNI